MAAIATYVVVVVAPLGVVYVFFQALVRGVPKDKDYEVEVRLFPPSIRRKVSASGRHAPYADAVPTRKYEANTGIDESEIPGSAHNPGRS
jgi:hypothetical protein